jgi:hypothetical protein
MDMMGRYVKGPTITLSDAPVYLLSTLTGGASHPARGHKRRSVVADLDGDGRSETVIMDPSLPRAVCVLRGGKAIAQDVPSRWKPWKLAAADVDGDGRTEIIVGVHKGTRYIPRPHNCLFVYGLRGSELQPVWLGSSLSRPFTDFVFAPSHCGRRWLLYAIEKTTSGRCAAAAYRWNGFGFTLDRRDGDWVMARFIGASRKGVTIQADGSRVILNHGAMAAPEPPRRTSARDAG